MNNFAILKIAYFQKCFFFWPYKFYDPILQQTICPGVEIFIEIQILAQFL